MSTRLPLSHAMYPEELVAPIRADLVSVGFEELRSAKEVEEQLPAKGTTLVYVNSICGCSARMGRPAVKMALQSAAAKPDRLTTVFAGQDREATERARAISRGTRPRHRPSPSCAMGSWST